MEPETAVNKYIHQSWNVRQGLPQNTVHAIVQDETGYIWLGTGLGLVRFDGSGFKTFNKTNTTAILNNSVTALMIDGKKQMWIGTYGGGVTTYKHGIFVPPVSPTTLSRLLVTAIIEDSRGRVWIGTTDNGILVENKDNTGASTFVSYNRSTGLSSNTVTALLAGTKGDVWIGTPNGLNRYSEGKFSHYSRHHGLAANRVTALHRDKKGDLWIGTSGGLNHMDVRNTTSSGAPLMDARYGVKDGLPGNYIRSIIQDRHDNIWIATGGGLARFNTDKDPDAAPLFSAFTETQGLSDNALLSLYEDRWGNLWVGSTAGGLNVLQDGRFTFYSEQDGLSGDHVKTVFQDKRGRIWIGTNGQGLNRWKEGKVVKTYTTEDGLTSNFIDSARQDREGNIWIGTPTGLNRLTGGKIKTFTTQDGLSHNAVRVLYPDRLGRLWIGTYGGGLNLYDAGEFTHFGREQGLPDNFVLALEQDGYGNMWVGTNRGVGCLDSQSKLFRRFSDAEGVPRGMVLDIYCDPQGVIWMATHNEGLIRYQNGVFRRFDQQWGFTRHPIYKIIEDRKQNLWFSSAGGIFSVPRHRLNNYAASHEGVSLAPPPERGQDALNWRHFQEQDGLRTSVCTGGSQPAGWMTGDGNIWFPTIKGIAVMDLKSTVFSVQQMPVFQDLPKDLKEQPKGFTYITVIREQPVIIDRIAADGENVELMADFTLPDTTGTLEFHFIAINYRTPGKTHYKYRLTGHDAKWQMKRETTATYKNLPSGEYEFRVYARTADGKWSTDYDSYTFSIQTSFFQSFIFYVLLITVLVLLLIFLPRMLEKSFTQEPLPHVKYLRSSLTAQKAKQHLDKLLHLMENDKPHLDADMSLQKLAALLDISKEDLSQVVNEQLKKNFKQFLNEYRVEEAKVKLLDPKEQDFVLMKIAFDVGFNSKSAFNASFKKVTGQTPSQYRKAHRKD